MEKVKFDISKLKEQYSSYLNQPEIVELNLSNDEICKWIKMIVTIVDATKKCQSLPFNKCVNNHFNHEVIYRNQKGQIVTCFVPCVKKEILKPWKFLDFYENISISEIPSLSQIFNEHKNDNKNDCNKPEIIKIALTSIINNALKNGKNKGLYLMGSYGIGKTYIMFAFGNAYAKQLKKTVGLVRVPNLVSKIKDNFDAQPSINQKLIQDLQNVDLLILDDLGAEQANDWFYNQYLFNILDYRYINNKLTCFTSNYSIDDFCKKLIKKNNMLTIDAKRVVERIRALVNNDQVKLKDHNYRY